MLAACDYVYCSYESLKRHVRNEHPNKINDLHSSLRSNKLYKCAFFPYNYGDIRNLRYDLKNARIVDDTNDNGNTVNKTKCPLCHFKAAKKA